MAENGVTVRYILVIPEPGFRAAPGPARLDPAAQKRPNPLSGLLCSQKGLGTSSRTTASDPGVKPMPQARVFVFLITRMGAHFKQPAGSDRGRPLRRSQ